MYKIQKVAKNIIWNDINKTIINTQNIPFEKKTPRV